MKENTKKTPRAEVKTLLSDNMLKKVVGGTDEPPEWLRCPRCNKKVYYQEDHRPQYECDCGWWSNYDT